MKKEIHKTKYWVAVEQISEQCFWVEASSKEEAQKIAKRRTKSNNKMLGRDWYKIGNVRVLKHA